MKKRILKILLCVSIMLILLPFTALADTASVNIGTTNLADGKYYTVKMGDDSSFALVDVSDDQPSEGTPYLYYSDGVLTVSGNVSLTSKGPSPLNVSGGTLTISGSGSLELSSSASPTVQLNSSVLSLDGSVDFTAEQTGTTAIPAINCGTLQTADDYSGDITINSDKGNALTGMSGVNLQTSGDISISGGSSPVINSNDNVTLKGSTVELTSSINGMLISGPPQVSITATDGDLSFSGNVNDPLLSATVTLSAEGNIAIENSGESSSGIAVLGNLKITKAEDVNILGKGGQAVSGDADITATGDVTIASQNNSSAVVALKVSGARNVTVTSNAAQPTITNSVDISVSGDVTVENTGNFGAMLSSYGCHVSIITSGGSISVSGRGAMPVIGASEYVTLDAEGSILVQRTDDSGCGIPLISTAGSKTLTSENGVVILSDTLGTTITIGDGSPISAVYGGEVLDGEGLNLNESTPTKNTYYKAGNGYVVWETSGKITLYNATISNKKEPIDEPAGMAHQGIALPLGDITIVVEGTNDISSTHGHGMGYAYTNVTLDGDGILNVEGQGSDIELTGSLGFAVGSNVKLKGIVYINYGSCSTTIYGNVTTNNDSFWGDTIIAPGAKLTIPEGVMFYLNDATSITNNGEIINNGTIFLPYDYTVQDIENLNITGSGEIFLFDSVTSNVKIYIDGTIYAYDEDTSVDISHHAPTEATCYKAGNGYIIFTPVDSTLTMHNVDSSLLNIILPNIPITMVLEGENEVEYIIAYNSVTVDGSGTLNAVYIYRYNSDAALSVNSGATLNTICLAATEDDVITATVYGSYYALGGFCFISSDHRLALSSGSVLTLENDVYLEFTENSPLDYMTIGEGAEIVNNSYMILPLGTTSEQIAALPLSGSGIVIVPARYNEYGEPDDYEYYTNSGVRINSSVGFDELTLSDVEVTADANLGYTWLESDDGVWTLTLNSVLIVENLELPYDKVVINTTADSNLLGNIDNISSNPCSLTFTGSGKLGINGNVWSGLGGEVTIDEGADVTLSGGINVGTSGGVNGVLTVDGTLSASSKSGSVINTGRVEIGSKGILNVTGEVGIKLNGMNSGEDMIYDDAFVIKNGGTLNADCKYVNIMVFTDNDEATEDAADDVIVIPDGYMPDGYSIRIVSGENGGTQYAYTIAKTNAALTLEAEQVYGAGGKLTLKKPSNNDDNDNDSHHSYHLDGSGSHSYILSFDTNGGSAISNVSKAYGTVIDLSTYKPVRDGYQFNGWYSDEELTNNVTSVKLNKNITVYAKWTQKASDNANTANPFTDMTDSDYYHDAVLWAVEKGITSGTTDTLFSPSMVCTRAQMVTLLWKAKGSPEPVSSFCSFTDVANNAYYYKAVLWAVENGITSGTTSTTFS
ncbi:MAG: S-layer homology domain-containing protein, partial [Candidatus Metalachnospira sp.]|nr:S-layer homology domain-containing protein [Candidatus Metalachnospira sp.]